jgi:4-hydroxybutyryl-CoA dehydratase/vinylacetyl-CoA-Delta-isomerase
MHGGGSPDGAKLILNLHTNLNSYIDLARNVGRIKEEIPAPEKKR